MKRRAFIKGLATLCCGVAAGIELALPSIAKPEFFELDEPPGGKLTYAMLEKVYEALKKADFEIQHRRWRDEWVALAS